MTEQVKKVAKYAYDNPVKTVLATGTAMGIGYLIYHNTPEEIMAMHNALLQERDAITNDISGLIAGSGIIDVEKSIILTTKSNQLTVITKKIAYLKEAHAKAAQSKLSNDAKDIVKTLFNWKTYHDIYENREFYWYQLTKRNEP